LFSRIAGLTFLVLFAFTSKGWGQVYADTVRSGTTNGTLGSSSVVNPGNAITSILADSSRLTATSTVGTYTAWLQLIFKNKTFPGNTFVFTKYKSTGSLLGGDVTGVAYSSSSGTANGTAQASFSQDVFAADGTRYLAVTATASTFNAVRLTLSSPVALGTNTADVFFSAYYNGVTCNVPLFTGTGATGISIGSIANPTQAIDGNLSTYSNFNVTLAAAGTMTQSVYYDSLGSSVEAATIALSVPASGLANLSLLGAVTIQAYNGNTAVGAAVSLSSLLTLNLLNTVGSDNPINISVVPGGVFNRIDITNTSTLNLLSGLRVYEVTLTPAKPTFITPPASTAVSVCNGSNVTLTADNPGAGNELRWYATNLASNTTVLGIGPYTSPFAITADTVFYVAAGKVGCSASSERVPVRVTVKPLPVKPVAPDVSICSGKSATLAVTSPVAGNTYTWYKTATGGTSIATGTSYVTTVLTADTILYLQADSANGCGSRRDTMTVTVKPLPAKPSGTDTVICSGTAITLSVRSPVGGNTYNWYRTAAGGASVQSGTTYTTSTLSADTILYLQADSTNGCSSRRDTVTVTVNPLPSIQFTSPLNICDGITQTAITYSNIQNAPLYYHIAWSPAAVSAGFSADTTDISIVNPVPVIIPNTAAPAAYNGNLIIKNALNNRQCPASYPFVLQLVALPGVSTITTFE